MGLIKASKAGVLRGEAERAVSEGRSVFAPRLNTPKTAAGFTGSVSGWAEEIEAVEDCGWSLVSWAVTVDGKGNPTAYPLFRHS